MPASFLDQYKKREGAYASPAAAPPPKPTTGPFANIPIPPPAPQSKIPVPSFIDQYRNRVGAFENAKGPTAPAADPAEGKKAAMAALLDETPEPIRKTGEDLRAVFEQIKLSMPPGPQNKIPSARFADLDLTPGPQSKLPKTFTQRLKDDFWEYAVKPTARLGINIGIGEYAAVESVLGFAQWLGVDSAKEPADKIGEWVKAAQKVKQEKAGAPEEDTFFDQLAQGLGSSIPFFVTGMGATSVAGALTRLSPRAAMIFGGSASAFLESSAEAGNVFRDMLATGKSRGEANEAAEKTFWANAILVLLTNRFGVFNPDAAGFVRRMVFSAPIEGVQEAGQQIIQNVAEKREDPLEGAGRSFLIGSIVGGIMGAGVESAQGVQGPSLQGDQIIVRPPTAPKPPKTPPEGPGAPPAAPSAPAAVETQPQAPQEAAATIEKGQQIEVVDKEGNIRTSGVVTAVREDGVIVRDERSGLPLLYRNTSFTFRAAAPAEEKTEFLDEIPPEVQEQADRDWSENFAEKYGELSGQLEKVDQDLRSAKGEEKQRLLAESERLGTELARMENEHLQKWYTKAQEGLGKKKEGPAEEELAAEAQAREIREDEILRARDEYNALPAEKQLMLDEQLAAGRPIEEIAQDVGTRVEVVASRQEVDEVIADLEEDMREIYRRSPNAQQELELLMAELLELSQPGFRYIDETTGEGKGVESTFPKWLPEDLRNAALFNRVFGNLQNIDGLAFPRGKRPKQRRLYMEVLDQLDARAQVDTQAIRNAILDLNGDDTATDTGLIGEAPVAIDRGDEGGAADRAGARPSSRSRSDAFRLGPLAFNIRGLFHLDSPAGVAETDKIVKRSDVARELSKGLGVPVRTGRFKDQALGIFKPWAHVVRLKSKLGDLRIPVLVHESAHFLDYTLMGEPIKTPSGKAWSSTKFVSSMIPREEINPLLVEYGGVPKSKKREAFAEFVRFYVTEPAKAGRAPKFLKIWEEQILPAYPEVREVLETTRTDWERWRRQPATAKVVSQISFGQRRRTLAEIGEDIVEGFHTLMTHWTDDLHPIKRFVNLAKEKKIDVSIEEDPYLLARLMRGWVGKAITFLEKGTFDVRFWKEEGGRAIPVFTGKGFKEILAPVAQKKATDDFSAWLVARRMIELAKRGIEGGVSLDVAEKAFADLSAKYPEFESIAADLKAYQDALMDYLYHSGLIEADMVAKMRVLNEHYVPFYRVMEAAESKGFLGKTLANVRASIKRIRGSDRDIIDPLESIVKNTYALINAAERNRVAIAMVNLSTRHPELAQLFEALPQAQSKAASVKIGDLIDKELGELGKAMLPVEAQEALDSIGERIVNIFKPSFFNKENELTIMIAGVPRTFRADKDIYRAMQGLDIEDVAWWMKILTYPARWLRAGATLTLEFIVRNPARDLLSAVVYSEYGFMPPVDIPRGIFGALKRDEDFWLWRMGGGEQATLVGMDRTSLKKTYDELVDKTTFYSVAKKANPVEWLRVLSEFTEKMTRIGEAKRAISSGANPLEAAFASREVTLDFAKAGTKGRVMNMVTAFFNAQVQGSARMVRAFKEKPYRTTAKTALFITLPSILLAFWNEREPDWGEVPQWRKNLFWNIKIGDTWYSWPKPFELGILFGSVPERIVEWYYHRDRNVWGALRKSITDGAMPGIVPTGALPILENATNYSFFFDRNIVPDSLEGLPPFAQYTSYTSETAKQVGKWLNFSPLKIDNLLRGYFAGLGRYATEGLDKIMRGTNADLPEPPEPELADLPLIRAFVMRNPQGSNSESINTFYNKAEAARAAKLYHEGLLKEGKDREAEEWLAQHGSEILLSTFYEKTRQTISNIRNAQTFIRDSKDLTPQEKRTKLDELNKLMTDIAHMAITATLNEQ